MLWKQDHKTSQIWMNSVLCNLQADSKHAVYIHFCLLDMKVCLLMNNVSL